MAYPDLNLGYTVRVRPDGRAFRIMVDLDGPLPAAWVGKVGFNLELFPGILFGKSYQIGGASGHLSPPAQRAGGGHGRRLRGGALRPRTQAHHRRGIGARTDDDPSRPRRRNRPARRASPAQQRLVRRPLPGSLRGAPRARSNGSSPRTPSPGGNPSRSSRCRRSATTPSSPRSPSSSSIGARTSYRPVALYRVTDVGLREGARAAGHATGAGSCATTICSSISAEIVRPGIYEVGYGRAPLHVVRDRSARLRARRLAAHCRVFPAGRKWATCGSTTTTGSGTGCRHIDDALMAPVNHNHFDGYVQGPSTLTKFKPGEHVPGLDRGGWFDAGDYDCGSSRRPTPSTGSRSPGSCSIPTLDNTTIDQASRIVEIHQPDGKPDVLQQIEHGVLSIVGGYNAMGRLYRGIQDASLHQYTFLGDAADMTDNQVFHDTDGEAMKVLAAGGPRRLPGRAEDRRPAAARLAGLGRRPLGLHRGESRRELSVAGALAAASRALKGFNDPLAKRLPADRRENSGRRPRLQRLPRTAWSRRSSFTRSTCRPAYAATIVGMRDAIVDDFAAYGWLGARAMASDQGCRVHGEDPDRAESLPVRGRCLRVGRRLTGSPTDRRSGAPAGTSSASACSQYFLHVAAPDLFPATLHAATRSTSSSDATRARTRRRLFRASAPSPPSPPTA